MLSEHSSALIALIAGSERHVIAEFDEQGKLVDCSSGFAHLVGRTEKPLGVPFGDLFTDEHQAPFVALPAPGYLVADAGPPGARTRLQAQVIRSRSATLVVAEQVHLERGIVEHLSKLSDEMTNLMRELHKEKATLERSIARIKRLEGIISICSYCHRIRNEQQAWQRLEEYLFDHADAQFSHGICPGCAEKHFGPEYGDTDG